ncbi:MAG TPA: cytochrome c3 family protein [Spirochaetota bacterium]|nr:cytochrome c3 family protein [Spirochaetota bacterium]HPC41187.1 cytochrome c3 family protein [Spirochaetota bacterium]HPL17128.1 cytochrome c3 family protein [Spirochaetota bacterium]HQF07107.1 cytochrome c3 family protein [Spirochaetota bacterium]HQH95844.1 cytochrome c3 family protein [Spirochaetota bacterium]
MKRIKTNRVVPAITAAGVLLLAGIAYSVEDVIVLPKTGHRKPPITFSHRAHTDDYGAKCIECHHAGKNVKCSTCHLRHDRGNLINLKGAFHQQCLGCHRKTSGPKGCGRCHQDRKR